MIKLNKLKYQYSFSEALPSNRAYFFKTSRYQFIYLLFVLPLVSLPDLRQGFAAASAQAQRLPKAVRWNEGLDAEQFMSRVFQTVLLELMQMSKTICLLWLVRKT
jgi:hypothetical protein